MRERVEHLGGGIPSGKGGLSGDKGEGGEQETWSGEGRLGM